MPPITDCSYQGSWDPAPISCSPEVVAFVNDHSSFVLNTDQVATDPDTCGPFWPPRPMLPFNTPAWFKVDVVINNVHYVRTINYKKPQYW